MPPAVRRSTAESWTLTDSTRRLRWCEVYLTRPLHALEPTCRRPAGTFIHRCISVPGYSTALTEVARWCRAVEQLPRSPWTTAPHEMSSRGAEGCNVCAVCTDEFHSDDTVARMPCQHLFHDECISKWLGETNSCPLCRLALPVDPPEEHARDDFFDGTTPRTQPIGGVLSPGALRATPTPAVLPSLTTLAAPSGCSSSFPIGF